ncbi:MAG: hypothetical protein HND51_22200 [Chloroflexi bacterium]|nr:hypothetical protein [Chloroflexota bacterium]
MSSRLQRLLHEPDTEDWKRYQRRWLVGNGKLSGWIAIILLLAGISHLVYSYFQINSQVHKGIPDDFYVVSLMNVYPPVEDLIAVNEQQVMIDRGSSSLELSALPFSPPGFLSN